MNWAPASWSYGQDCDAFITLAMVFGLAQSHRQGDPQITQLSVILAVNALMGSGQLNDWNRMIDVNLRGVLHRIAAALPVFRTQGSGHFVTLSRRFSQTVTVRAGGPGPCGRTARTR